MCLYRLYSGCFLKHFKHLTPPYHSCTVSKNSSVIDLCSSISKVFLNFHLPGSFKTCSFIFCNLNMICLGFCLLVLVVIWCFLGILKLWLVVYHSFWKIYHYLGRYFFCFILSFSSGILITSLEIVPPFSDVLFWFLVVYLTCFDFFSFSLHFVKFKWPHYQAH